MRYFSQEAVIERMTAELEKADSLFDSLDYQGGQKDYGRIGRMSASITELRWLVKLLTEAED